MTWAVNFVTINYWKEIKSNDSKHDEVWEEVGRSCGWDKMCESHAHEIITCNGYLYDLTSNTRPTFTLQIWRQSPTSEKRTGHCIRVQNQGIAQRSLGIRRLWLGGLLSHVLLRFCYSLEFAYHLDYLSRQILKLCWSIQTCVVGVSSKLTLARRTTQYSINFC